jgi:hypothetical protein
MEDLELGLATLEGPLTQALFGKVDRALDEYRVRLAAAEYRDYPSFARRGLRCSDYARTTLAEDGVAFTPEIERQLAALDDSHQLPQHALVPIGGFDAVQFI